MASTRYMNALLTLILAALLVIAVQLSMVSGPEHVLSVGTPVSAQGVAIDSDVTFAPWINPRRFVFFDKKARMIYIYNADGKIDETWVVGALGEPLAKK